MAVLAQAEPLDLHSEMRGFIGRHTDKSFDWDAFPGNLGFPDLGRAQMRYSGAGVSPKADDPSTLRPGQFTLSLVHQPVGKYAACHSHEVVEHFLVLEGVLTVGWAWGDEVIEARLGPKDMVLNQSGRPHGFRNDGVEPVLMSISVGSGLPKPPVYVCHPREADPPPPYRPPCRAAPGMAGGFCPDGLCRRGRRPARPLPHGHGPSAEGGCDPRLYASGGGRLFRAGRLHHRRLGGARARRRGAPRPEGCDLQPGRPGPLFPERRSCRCCFYDAGRHPAGGGYQLPNQMTQFAARALPSRDDFRRAGVFRSRYPTNWRDDQREDQMNSTMGSAILSALLVLSASSGGLA